MGVEIRVEGLKKSFGRQVIWEDVSVTLPAGEISALLGVPLGVARVLVADMEADGLVRVYQPQLQAGLPDRGLLERVLSGLRRL